MFSSLPKLADKAFVIAFLIPFVAFSLAVIGGFGAWPLIAAAHKALGSQKDLADLTIVAAGVWFGAVALLLLNRPLYRALEGYIGPLAAPSRVERMKVRWQQGFDALVKAYDFAEAATDADKDAADIAYRVALADFRLRYPAKKERVLGTRFGNVNRAFEDYPWRVYRVEGIAVWPRLSAVIPKDFQASLGDARAQVDCFVNLSVLSIVFSLLEVGQWLWSLLHLDIHGGANICSWVVAGALAAYKTAAWPCLGWAGGAALFAWAAYWLMLDRAIALGEQVKSAFDLYLGALAKQLGYKLPDTLDEQERLWSALRRSYAYFEPALQDSKIKDPAPPVDAVGAAAAAEVGAADEVADDRGD